MPHHVLIVDDEEAICWALNRVLSEDGHEVAVAASAEEALSLVARRRPDLIVMDVRLPGLDGLSAIERLNLEAGPIPVVVITAFGSLDTAVAALSQGAIDYLPKPFDLDQAAAVIRRALDRGPALAAASAAESPASRFADGLVGACPAMQQVFKQIALVAGADLPVLITGESGTGKELVALAIHRHSQRADKPFVPVHLAALNPMLVESELFGHVRGAFTGAEAARDGILALAHGATVFFDEAGEIPPHVQVKLLRVLEQREITPVGDARPRSCDFRVIAATNRDLTRSLAEGGFRQDLYFRLAAFEIAIPPLRDRVQDIPLLAEHFLASVRPNDGARPRFAEETIRELCRRPWPGNVRELRHAVEHAALRARGLPIGPEHLPPARELSSSGEVRPQSELERCVRAWAAAELATPGEPADLYERLLAIVEPPLFEAALARAGGQKAAAADILGMHRATLRKKLNP